METRKTRPLIIGLLCAAVIAIGCWRLRFDVDVLNLLPKDLPAAVGIKLYQTNFANARELIITVQSGDAENCERQARLLADVLSRATNLVTAVVWQPLWLERPADTAEFVAYSWLNQSPDVFQKLSDSLNSSNLPTLVSDSRETLTTSFSPEVVGHRSYDPLRLTEVPTAGSGAQTFGDGSGLFASEDGTFRLIFLQSATDISDYRQCTKWLNALKTVVAEHTRSLPSGSEIQVRYTGRPAFVSEISNGMQKDMTGPSLLTLAVIAVLFYWTHRRIKPLLWLTVLLLSILAGTCAIGGLIFGTLNIVSFGFASILLGLAEDFGIVLYQESRTNPELNATQVRKIAAPGIFWSTVTTCSAFLVLNLGGLPGLGQLGTLVAIGIAVAAVVMLYAFLPPLMRGTNRPAPMTPHASTGAGSNRPSLIGTVVVIVLCASLLAVKRPGFDNSPDALRPKRSEAYAAAEEVKIRLKRTQEPLWLLVTGSSEDEVLRRLRAAERELNQAVTNGIITGVTLPISLWPDTAAQRKNISAAQSLLARRGEIRNAVLAGGFTSNALALSDAIFTTWANASASTSAYWPTNKGSRWILEKFTARSGTNLFALGLIERRPDTPIAQVAPPILKLSQRLASENIFVSGWEILGNAIFARVRTDFWKILVPMAVLVLVSLWLAFRSVREVMLSVATLCVSAIILWAIMALAGWSWNLLNLMAIPLLLGMGVDFSIHIQMALKRHHGDLKEVRASIGSALLLAGSTTVVGFASLALSNNAGLASLGKVCAMGIVVAMLVSVFLLPHWWATARRGADVQE